MRKYFLLPVLMILPLVVLTMMSITFGHSFGITPTNFGKIENCNLPCWNGIQPGVTLLNDAIAVLSAMGYVLQSPKDVDRLQSSLSYKTVLPDGVCQVGVGRSGGVRPIVTELTLRFCDGASLGHILDMLGAPDTVLPIASLIYYQSSQVSVVLDAPMCRKVLSPHTPLLFIDVLPQLTQTQSNLLKAEAATGKDDDSTNLPWQGFIPVWRYDQLFPGRAIC
jgi:hypothetical protein